MTRAAAIRHGLTSRHRRATRCRIRIAATRRDNALGVREWNPLRAMKDVEVGDFYYKRENYMAAISRYREALQFKPRDAVATFKLAQALEKTKELPEARARYEEYLAILKDGPSADEARKALQRLNKQ